MRIAALCYLVALFPSCALASQKPEKKSPASVPSMPAGGLRLHRTSSTPYDRYFGSVQAVIASTKPRRATMGEVRQWMIVANEFSYVERHRYRPDSPRVTQAMRAGDCKSKSLWLYRKLADPGALFVIGKTRRDPRTNHAWVYWHDRAGWWILDSTFGREPIPVNALSSYMYVPFYAYGQSGTYRFSTEAPRIKPVAY